MATIRKHRKSWVADYRDQHGIRHVEVPAGDFENRAHQKLAARALLTKRLAEVKRGQHIPASQRPSFSEVCDRYLESKVGLRGPTLRRYRGLIDLYLRPYFGTWNFETIAPADIERFRYEMTQGVPAPVARAIAERLRAAKPRLAHARARQVAARKQQPSTHTINALLTMMTMLFNYACRHRYVDYNPAEHVERVRNTAPPDELTIDCNILAPGEIKKLIDSTDDNHYRLIIQVAVFTGMRQGEILGLKWGDLDWNSRQIHVRRAWKEGQFSEPKTRTSIRKVDVPALLIHDLKKWKLRCPKGELDLMFPNGAGNPESHANLLQRGFYPALRRAGLRKVHFHGLRHSYASLMLANGEDIVRVSRLLGHANPTITLNVYAHMLPREHYGSTDRLAKLVYGDSGAPEPKPTTDHPVNHPFTVGVDPKP
jgi:integrase